MEILRGQFSARSCWRLLLPMARPPKPP